jgi:hypothetical protein
MTIPLTFNATVVLPKVELSFGRLVVPFSRPLILPEIPPIIQAPPTEPPVYASVDFSSAETGEVTALPRVRDLAYDHKTNRFFQSGGDLVLTRDRDAIRQAVQIRLSTILGEWFLATDAGVPWFDRVLVKSPNLRAIESVFRQKIETTPGILTVTALSVNFDRRIRKLSVNWTASTDLGELSGEVSPALPAS